MLSSIYKIVNKVFNLKKYYFAMKCEDLLSFIFLKKTVFTNLFFIRKLFRFLSANYMFKLFHRIKQFVIIVKNGLTIN